MSTQPQNSAKISHYLGVDFGLAKVGLAIADSETKIAFAYKTLENNSGLFNKLKEIIAQEEIGKIIIGKLNSKIRQEAFDIENIGKDFADKLGVEVEYQEEMFSTKMAETLLKEKGAKKIKNLDNQEAARIILQSWLDK